MANGGGNGVWKAAAAALGSALLAAGGAWIALGREAVERSEMVEYVQTQSPWLRDAGEVKGTVGRLEGTVDKILEAQKQLLVEQRVLAEKVDRMAR